MSDPAARSIWAGVIVNVALAAGKFAAGSMASSMALAADGLHSAADLLTDACVLIGVKCRNRPADVNHPYGHEKIAAFASVFAALALVAVSLAIVWRSAQSFLGDHHPRWPYAIILTAMTAVACKEWVFRITRRAARAAGQADLLTHAWHHRFDALSSVAVIASATLTLCGWPHGDQLAGVIVGVMVSLAGVKVFGDSIRDLSDSAVSSRVTQTLAGILKDTPEVRSWHAFRGRRVGPQVFLDCHVLVDPSLTVAHSHALTEQIEQRLKSALNPPTYLLIHIEPCKANPPATRF